jgi:SAM-dependent methyltransferase
MPETRERRRLAAACPPMPRLALLRAGAVAVLAALAAAAPAQQSAAGAPGTARATHVAQAAPAAAPPAQAPLRRPDVRYEPSEQAIVDIMLRMGEVGAGDVVYDLGCGDGRIVIAAARERKARGVCVDIDPQRIAESRANARRAGVEDRIAFRNEDLLATDLREATVVMLFLSPDLNLRLRPRLLKELAPGTRVVSHWHDMGDWKPEKVERARGDGRARNIYLWRIPAR